MSHTWHPPTLADDRDLPADAVVRCPSCRRRVRADMVYDLRPIAMDPAFVCDACRSTLIRSGGLRVSAYLRACRAPAALIARHERQEEHRVPRG